jgi:hypothetical protein
MPENSLIIYLDQNKWIDLARIYHGKDSREQSKRIFDKLLNLVESNKICFPLSSIHYMETARNRNLKQREKTGEVMWLLSKGITIAPYNVIMDYEIRKALSKRNQLVKCPELKLIGYGISHAFGEMFRNRLPPILENEFERSCITGTSTYLNSQMNSLPRSQFAEKFKNHLLGLDQARKELPKQKWQDFLHAISVLDVNKDLYVIMQEYKIPVAFFNKETLSEVVEDMPSRRLDVHLHNLILSKPDYCPKITDLEDWAGAGLAAMYCDIVVCEKHLADMLRRNKFKTKAKVLTNIEELDSKIDDLLKSN